MTAVPAPPRMAAADLARLGAAGLRTSPLRAVLSALGIAIGIAAMISVVGISSSSRAQLDQQLAKLGTNLLTAAPGKTLGGDQARLPPESVPMVGRIPGVRSVSATGSGWTTAGSRWSASWRPSRSPPSWTPPP